MSHSETHVDAVNRAVARWLSTLVDNANVCVAYSGGVDSSVLLHALARARERHPTIRLSAIHIHHGLSANADAWTKHCEATCARLQVPLEVRRVKVENQSSLGVEAAARAARYEAIRVHAQATHTTIALAHHARDQAETVLLQMLRGAGPAGLAAMPDASPPFARPLIDVEKTTIDAYAKEHAIDHIVDESNDDERFARNRLRRLVWPALAGAFTSAERTLARAAKFQFEADQLACDLAQIDLAFCAESDVIIASKWRTLTSARRRNALRFWLTTHGVGAPGAERLTDWERQLLTDNPTQNVTLTHASIEGSIRLYRDRICFVAPGFMSMEQARPGIQWKGESTVKFGVGVVRFVTVDTQKHDPNTKLLRPILQGESWRIRTRREGDRIVLSPKSGGVSMKNLFQQSSIPPWLRSEWPILTCNGMIAAVPGIAIANEFRAKHGETGFLLSWEIESASSATS